MQTQIAEAGKGPRSNIFKVTGHLPEGFVVDEQYEIIKLLGSGGMCNVYQARDLRLHRLVALKLLHKRLISDETSVQRFQREALATAKLHHPNIVSVYAFGLWYQQPYIVMELLDGRTLADILDKDGALEPQRALRIMLQICDGLERAHETGIVHRDLKPSNVMVTADQEAVKIVDFGIAQLLPKTGAHWQRLTQTAEVVGTAHYMSPEQISGGKVDQRTDVYAFGCLMHEMLTGKPPYEGDTAFAIMHKHITESPSGLGNVAEPWRAIVASTLSKYADKRPQRMRDVREALNSPAPRTEHLFNFTPARAWLTRAAVISLSMLIGGVFAACYSAQFPSHVLSQSLQSAASEADGDALLDEALHTRNPHEQLQQLLRITRLKSDANVAAVCGTYAWLVDCRLRLSQPQEAYATALHFRQYAQEKRPNLTYWRSVAADTLINAARRSGQPEAEVVAQIDAQIDFLTEHSRRRTASVVGDVTLEGSYFLSCAYLDRAEMLAHDGKLQEAEQVARQAASLMNAEDPPARGTLDWLKRQDRVIAVLMDRGNTKSAKQEMMHNIGWLDTMYSKAAWSEYLIRSQRLLTMHAYKQAAAVVTRALANGVPNPAAYQQRAAVYRAAHQSDLAALDEATACKLERQDLKLLAYTQAVQR